MLEDAGLPVAPGDVDSSYDVGVAAQDTSGAMEVGAVEDAGA